MSENSNNTEIGDIIAFDYGGVTIYKAFVSVIGISMGKEYNTSGFAYTHKHDATEQDWVDALYNPIFI